MGMLQTYTYLASCLAGSYGLYFTTTRQTHLYTTLSGMLRVGTQTSEASFSARKFEIKRNVLLSGRRWSLALEQRNWLRISRFCGKFHLLDRISPRRYAAETG